MNGKIFTVYHFVPEPGTYRADDLYQPVIMGHEVDGRPDLLSDLHGDPYYEPLPAFGQGFDDVCGKWYVWKNLLSKYDWFGFQQYRRPLSLGERSNDEIRALAEQYDIIIGGFDNATKNYPNMRHTFMRDCPVSPCPWTAFEKAMGDGYNFTMPLNHAHNSWIMRADEFDSYMTKWRDVFIFNMAKERPWHNPPPSERTKPNGEVMSLFHFIRVYGHLGERFTTLYIDRLRREKPNMKVFIIPGIQDGDWPIGLHRPKEYPNAR